MGPSLRIEHITLGVQILVYHVILNAYIHRHVWVFPLFLQNPTQWRGVTELLIENMSNL